MNESERKKESTANSFVIRSWLEIDEDKESAGILRGWVRHVQSNQQHAFQGTKALFYILGLYFEKANPIYTKPLDKKRP